MGRLLVRRRPGAGPVAGLALLSLFARAPGGHAADCAATSVGRTPLSDLGTGLYLGVFEGGLYPGGSNEPPPAHHAEGLARALAAEPLDASGFPSSTGRHALLSVGMSNSSLEFCSSNGLEPCEDSSFAALAAEHPGVVRADLAIVNGTRSSLDAQAWQGAGAPSIGASTRSR